MCVSLSEPSIFYFSQKETKSQIDFCCTFQTVGKMIKFLVHDCFVKSFHCVVEYFVSRPFNFGIHQEILTRTQLSSQRVILNISHYVFLIRFALGVESFYVDVKRKIPETLDKKCTLEFDIKFWGAVLLGNIVIQINLGFCGAIGTLCTLACTSRTTLLVTRQIKFFCLGTAIVTSNFFVSIERRHFNIRSFTESSEKNVKVEAT